MSPKSPAGEPEEFLPLSHPVYQILLTLGDATMHGYGIIQEFERQTGHVGALLPGSLYNTMGRMLKAGLVEEADGPGDAAHERRRYYAVTELGREVARAESRRLRSLLRLAEDRRLVVEDPETV